jgi:hypothetical protein
MLRQTVAASSGVTGFIALIRDRLDFKSPFCDLRAGDEVRRGLVPFAFTPVLYSSYWRPVLSRQVLATTAKSPRPFRSRGVVKRP